MQSRFGFIAKLIGAVIVPSGIAIIAILPISYPIKSPMYQQLPTVLPLLGGVFSAVFAWRLFSPFNEQVGRLGRFVTLFVIAVFWFMLSYGLAMIVLLNVKGS